MSYQKNIRNNYTHDGIELIDKVITNINQIENGKISIMSSDLIIQLINDVETSTSNNILRNRVSTLEEKVELLEQVIHNLQNNN